MSVRYVWCSDLVAPAGEDFISLTKSEEVMRAAGWPRAAMAAPAEPRHLARVHDLRYVRGVLDFLVPNGFGNTKPKVLQHILAANGVMIRAVQEALETPQNAICAPVSGFHHARYAEASGYCTFNGLLAAVAAERASGRSRLRRVLIIDGDAHYGDGTDDILSRTSVSGITNLTHKRIGPNALDAKVWEMQIRGLLTNHAWDLVLYQAGADAHESDPYGDGYPNDEQWNARDSLVFSLCRAQKFPLVFNLAGGYNGDATIALHVHTIRTAEALYRSSALA